MRYLKLFENFKINAIRQEILYETFERDPKTGHYNSNKRIQGKSK